MELSSSVGSSGYSCVSLIVHAFKDNELICWLTDTPLCFVDTSVSLGGDFCPDDIPVSERINCHPEEGLANETVCLARGCFWCPSTDDPAAPECFAPRQQGYRVVGPVEDTPSGGLRVRLERIDTPSWFGANIINAWVEVEFLTDDRLRIKVQISTFCPSVNHLPGKVRWKKHHLCSHVSMRRNFRHYLVLL